MKKLCVTYIENGTPKKGVISETRYQELRNNPSVSDVIVYPNEFLMENNYSIITGNGNGNRSILID